MPADVFVLTDPSGSILPPAVQATALAKYSRSPLTAREIVRSITPEQANEFQQKWGVAYGHSSIAELATLPFCFEGVSIVASKVLERYQRGAYSEKSTRYQEFSGKSFVNPAPLHAQIYFPTELMPSVSRLYETYATIRPKVEAYVAKKMDPGSPPAVVRARAFDAIRYLLPAGTGTNLAAVWNARDARYVMNDLLSHPVLEMREIGEKMLVAARAVAPVFAMGVRPNEHRSDVRSCFGSPDSGPVVPGVVVRDQSCNTATHLFFEMAEQCGFSDGGELSKFMEARGKEPPPEFFRLLRITFELTMDYGAFRDLQRHRRCEQFVSPLTVDLGYVVPDDVRDAGAEVLDAFCGAMEESRDAVRDHGVDVLGSQYAIPLGFLHRSVFSMDLQELYYVVELRTQPQGHISYRRIAYQMFEAALAHFPREMQWCRAIRPDAIGAHA
jgi:thymidylate synthase ThyX